MGLPMDAGISAPRATRPSRVEPQIQLSAHSPGPQASSPLRAQDPTDQQPSNFQSHQRSVAQNQHDQQPLVFSVNGNQHRGENLTSREADAVRAMGYLRGGINPTATADSGGRGTFRGPGDRDVPRGRGTFRGLESRGDFGERGLLYSSANRGNPSGSETFRGPGDSESTTRGGFRDRGNLVDGGVPMNGGISVNGAVFMNGGRSSGRGNHNVFNGRVGSSDRGDMRGRGATMGPAPQRPLRGQSAYARSRDRARARVARMFPGAINPFATTLPESRRRLEPPTLPPDASFFIGRAPNGMLVFARRGNGPHILRPATEEEQSMTSIDLVLRYIEAATRALGVPIEQIEEEMLRWEDEEARRRIEL